MIGKFRSSPRLLAVSVIALAVAVGALAGATIDRTLNRYPGAAIELTDPAPVPPRPEGDELREGRLERSPEGHHTWGVRSEEHTSELQSRGHIVCRLLLEIKN